MQLGRREIVRVPPSLGWTSSYLPEVSYFCRGVLSYFLQFLFLLFTDSSVRGNVCRFYGLADRCSWIFYDADAYDEGRNGGEQCQVAGVFRYSQGIPRNTRLRQHSYFVS